MDLSDVSEILEAALREDVGSGDVTAAFTPNRCIRAEITANSSGVISGLEEAILLFKNHKVAAKAHVKDGASVEKGQKVLTLEGLARDLLPVERTALNFISRMSGVSTATREYADALKKHGSKAKIVATRKATPGLMRLEKKAVKLGGGLTHRMGLYDMILIKDNHLLLYGGDVGAALADAMRAKGGLKVEAEVETVKDAVLAAEGGADLIMFDNIGPSDISEAIRILKEKGLRKKILLEVSGGVTLGNIGEYAGLDVDWISSGRLTTAAPWLDYSLHILKEK
ncbi:MAG: carboxylating nicotinate-nucleotide diphosphorylase [Candidatus Altiarchaeota archaeon]